MVKQRNKKYSKCYNLLYLILLVVITSAIVYMAVQYKGPTPAQDFFSESVAFEDGWTTSDGSPVILNQLNDLDIVEPYHPFSIYNKLPDALDKGAAFCFRSKNVFYQVFIDGVLVYEPYVPENIFYNDTIGTRWNYIPLSPEDAGKTVELRITTVYDSSRTGFSSSYIGAPGRIILETMQQKMVSFITCVLILFVGLLLIILDFPINFQTNRNHELLYLGLFSISISIWCLTETNFLQFFIGDTGMLSVLSCCSLMLISIPLVLYLDSAFGFQKRFVVSAIVFLSFAGFVVCLTLHLLGIADFRSTLRITHIVLAISAGLLLYTIMRHALFRSKNQPQNIYRVLRGIGLCSLSVATAIDLFRFYSGNGGDAAMFVRIGLLIFIVCYGTASLERTINAVKLGIQTEFVSQLAYRDGLTGIGNRTAFQEHLVSLESRKAEFPGIGIVVFDVNDLKFVNDYFGHPTGDAMLVQSAKIIQEAFQSVKGDCYRIGGDEFSVILSGESVKERCEQALAQFQTLTDTFNKQPNKPFRVRIAQGYAVYDRQASDQMLMDIYRQADSNMYMNKKWMKQNLISIESLYGGTTTKLSNAT